MLTANNAKGGNLKWVLTWGPPDATNSVVLTITVTGTSNPTGDAYSPGSSGTVTFGSKTVALPPGSANSPGILNTTWTERAVAGSTVVVNAFIENGIYRNKNVVIMREEGRWRTSPLSFENPYDFPLKLNFYQNGNLIGSRTLAPGSQNTFQIDSPGGQDIRVQGVAEGYTVGADGTLVPGTPTQSAVWTAGIVPAGEQVAVAPGMPSTGTTGGTSSGTVRPVAPTTGQVGWTGGAGSATGALDAGTFRQGVEAIVAATKEAGKGTGGTGLPGEPIDPRPNIDQFREAVQERWTVEDEESQARRSAANDLAAAYQQSKSFSAPAKIAEASAQYQAGLPPAGWVPKGVGTSDPGGAGSLTLPGPAGDIHVSLAASAMPGGLSGVASWGKALLLLAAGVWLVRGCLADMRAYLVGLGAVSPAGSGVLVGVESVAPGVPQAKAVGLALAATAVMATAWAGLAAFLSSGVLGEAAARMTGFSLNGGLGVLGDWIPFAGLVAIWAARATFDLVAAPVYLAAVGAMKFLSV